MSIIRVLILIGLAITAGLFRKARGWVLLVFSTALVFWLQPHFGNATVTYLVPTATLVLLILSWAVTSTPGQRKWRQTLPAILILLAVAGVFWLNRFFQLDALFETSTPNILYIAAIWGVALIGFVILGKLQKLQKGLLLAFSISIIVGLVLVKSDYLAGQLRTLINHFLHRDSPSVLFQIQWLGFSYIAFRLVHTFIEKRAGRLPEVSLPEYINYVIFFPALQAGPIDRLDRFLGDLRNGQPIDRDGLLFSTQRIVFGVFKKFVIADALAMISFDKFYTYVRNPLWLWLFLYFYAFRIYFDFSGYTDIAIGLGRLAGFRLPENFDKPYLKPNLTLFWNSWHMTLTQWFRSYFFNPVVRKLRMAKRRLPDFISIFIAQTATMALIGLWHGITVNFLLWGLWHGIGLFIHNRWSAAFKSRVEAWAGVGIKKKLINAVGVVATFNFIALGWVFFLLPKPAEAVAVFARLFGVS